MLSVSQLTRDNKVFFEFHANVCFVKSQVTKEVLLQGRVKEDGLYIFYKIPLSHLVSSPLQIVHTDLWGPSSTKSFNGFSYFMHFVDSYSRYTWIYFLKTKDEALNTFQNFKSMVELQFNTKIKTIQSDGGRILTYLQIPTESRHYTPQKLPTHP